MSAQDKDNRICGAPLETQSLSVGYDSDVIADITLSVMPGKIVTLIGPNGSGKSTILKTVTGELKKRGGLILIEGSDRSKLNRKSVAKKLSMVMTKTPRPELMTCREVIESGRYPYTGLLGKLSEEDKKAVEEAIEVTQTLDIADKNFTDISDGQRQRVMLARSICQQPDVLVLDEPVSYLDIRYRADILGRIKELTKSRKLAVLMSLHEPDAAMMLSDTVVAIGDGKVKRIGTVNEVFEEEFIRGLYGLDDRSVKMLSFLPWFPGRKAASQQFSKGVIMVMGTMSNVGKSVITAGLCRVFSQDGYSVAPFKSQNMANNSYVTSDGLEMGRAQVLQAIAAGTEPDVSMNPILLKPTDDRGSQVVVNGVPIGTMKASEYFTYKKNLMPVIMEAYEKLRKKYDIIVIEGAGSPAEINLKENDIVNMGVASAVNAPVLLVGDIDRGGVFAQLLGTLDLLEDDERLRVRGLIINMFRGDPALLEDGLRMLEERAGCQVMGIVPYAGIHLDDEDSISERFSDKGRKSFDIAVIRLPHIANYTDFGVFDQAEDVSVRYVSTESAIGDADIVVLPGTKNTMSDMKWMDENGMSDEIRRLAANGTVIIGICGGYQMLGLSISDPEGAEGGGSIEGLGLLPVETVISHDKVRHIYEGTIQSAGGVLSPLNGMKVSGYEIHMGRTGCTKELSVFTENTGYCRGNVYGTYVHGLFDAEGVAPAIVSAVAKERGKNIDVSGFSGKEDYLEKQLDILAGIVRKSLDMNKIYAMMRLSEAEENE
ncbi:MAG: cobyric acid synthase [Lachnospiraceae bacterium]|nr:cobyric acid synthase [Lachnospiraceae bacterium]